MHGLIEFAKTVVPGSLHVNASVGDDRNALLMMTVKTDGPPFRPMTLPAAWLYLLDENHKIKVERFTRAFESNDVDGVVGLLTENVWFTMPPAPCAWQGRDRAAQFLTAVTAWSGPGRRLVATRANGQPAFCLYIPDCHANVLHALGLLVLTLAGNRVSAITRFDNSVLSYFGLPQTLAVQHGPRRQEMDQ